MWLPGMEFGCEFLILFIRILVPFEILGNFHFDMQVSEILDSELLGEGLIPTLQHAHDMLLVENPLTVPYRATTYGQVFDQVPIMLF